VDCDWLELPGGTAAVELARASGLPLLAAPDPLGAQTTGLGQVIGHALDAGARQLLVGLGGSAATDGGTGALAGAGLVITGEGRYDRTSGTGKVAGAVLAAAATAGVPAALVAGQIADRPPLAVRAAVALADLAGGAGPARADPGRWLRLAGRRLAVRDPAALA
jgi:glycerate kinase